MPCGDSRDLQEEDPSYFLARTQPMKGHRLSVYWSPHNFLFLSVIFFFLLMSCGGLACGSPRLQTLNCDSAVAE